MTCELVALCVDANDPARLAAFWSGLLGWTPAPESPLGSGEVRLLPNDGTGIALRKPEPPEPAFPISQDSRTERNEFQLRVGEAGLVNLLTLF